MNTNQSLINTIMPSQNHNQSHNNNHHNQSAMNISSRHNTIPESPIPMAYGGPARGQSSAQAIKAAKRQQQVNPLIAVKNGANGQNEEEKFNKTIPKCNPDKILINMNKRINGLNNTLKKWTESLGNQTLTDVATGIDDPQLQTCIDQYKKVSK
eukprot:466236_1